MHTTFILFPDQLAALKQAATRMQREKGGKADHSEVMRLALDAIATEDEPPYGLKDVLFAESKERRQAARGVGRT